MKEQKLIKLTIALYAVCVILSLCVLLMPDFKSLSQEQNDTETQVKYSQDILEVCEDLELKNAGCLCASDDGTTFVYRCSSKEEYINLIDNIYKDPDYYIIDIYDGFVKLSV